MCLVVRKGGFKYGKKKVIWLDNKELHWNEKSTPGVTISNKYVACI